ncbi:putative ABC transporter permease [Lacrimispora celerecrescens]|uniref:Putative membrane protein n=1 Tax=[Clostridium] celerecrescens 18A TaxID=1286362 RepID=A0A2M8Z8W7_9FIRM|nr:putative ABC transporter permease [Lacrimispora celerecrescens]PJJ29897.1 putative membrane protein [[Clostridium] celerecrescens 18A]
MYLYTWYQWLLFFFIYCFIGWIIESTYVSVRSLHFVNRGFLRLPLLPLYGSGAIIMLWLSIPVQGNLFLVFLFGMLGASALEYVTGYVMERLFKMKYWDYSSNPFNINGYVCLTNSIAWGFLTLLLTEVIHRPLEWLVLHLNGTACIILVIMVGILFITDAIRSTKEALDLGRILETMTKLKSELDEVQVQMALLKAETAQKVSDIKTETIMKAASLKGETMEKISSLKAETASALKESALVERLQSLTETKEKLTGRLTSYRKGILRRNPTASSRLFGEALRELKEYSKKYKKS